MITLTAPSLDQSWTHPPIALQDALLDKCSTDDLSEAEDHIKILLAPQKAGEAENFSVKLLWFANEKDMDASIDPQLKAPVGDNIMPENITEVSRIAHGVRSGAAGWAAAGGCGRLGADQTDCVDHRLMIAAYVITM